MMSKRTDKIQVSLSPEERQRIDDWQFENRLPSRAAAIRELVGRSIAHAEVTTTSTPHSRAVGVVETPLRRAGPPSFTIADATAPDMPLVFVSDGFLKLCGYARDEVIGRNCRFLQGPRTRASSTEILRDAIARRSAAETELINYRKTGEAYRIHLAIEPLTIMAENRPHAYVGVQTYLGEA